MRLPTAQALSSSANEAVEECILIDDLSGGNYELHIVVLLGGQEAQCSNLGECAASHKADQDHTTSMQQRCLIDGSSANSMTPPNAHKLHLEVFESWTWQVVDLTLESLPAQRLQRVLHEASGQWSIEAMHIANVPRINLNAVLDGQVKGLQRV